MDRPLTSLLPALVLALTGCPSPTPPGGDGGEPGRDAGIDAGVDGGVDAGVTASEAEYLAWCRAVALKLCRGRLACNELAPRHMNQCLAEREAAWCSRQPAIRLGSLAFDAGAGAQCLIDLTPAASTCDTATTTSIFFTPWSCADALQPRAHIGQSCASPLDCVDADAGCVMTTCPFSCQAGGGEGQPCPTYGGCANGLLCAGSTNTCLRPYADGTPCTSNLQCSSSFCDGTQEPARCGQLPVAGQACARSCLTCSGYRCAASAYCDSQRRCQNLMPVGTTGCSYATCVDSAYCDYGSPRTCRAKVAVGQPCNTGTTCVDDGYCDGLRCEPKWATGAWCDPRSAPSRCRDSCDEVLLTCQALAFVDAGAPCTGSEIRCSGLADCVGARFDGTVGFPGTDAGWRSGTVGRCIVPALGDPCATGLDCPLEGTSCHLDGGADAGVCATAARGAPCVTSRNCDPTSFCVRDVCVARLDAGAPCDYARLCAPPLYCVSAQDGGQICGEPLDEGAACSTDKECKLYLDCVGGRCTLSGLVGTRCYRGDCQLSYCSRSSEPFQCVPLKADGSPCSVRTECASRACVNGTCRPASCR